MVHSTRPNLAGLIAVGTGLAFWSPCAHADSMLVELTPYTKQIGYALMRIDDAAQEGQIEFTVEIPAPHKGRIVGIFLNFLGPRPEDITVASVSGPTVFAVELDTKDLGRGNNVNPSPSERPKGLFDLGIAVFGRGTVVFRIDNASGQFDAYSFGPFAAVVEYEKGEGGVAKLYGVPVLPAASAHKPTSKWVSSAKRPAMRLRRVR